MDCDLNHTRFRPRPLFRVSVTWLTAEFHNSGPSCEDFRDLGLTKILFPSSSQRSLHMTSVASFAFLLSLRWRDEKHYFLVSNRRRVVNHGQKKRNSFFCVKKNTIWGWNRHVYRYSLKVRYINFSVFFFHRCHKKNTLFFVIFYLFIANFEVFPKKRTNVSILEPSLHRPYC